jgi:hypothetical protein
MSQNKVYIIIWKQEVNNYKRKGFECYWGFGDMLRGVCAVFDVCQELNIKLYVDMRYHPIGQFFKHVQHGFEELIDNNINNINLDIFNTRQSITDHINNKFKDSNIYFNAAWGSTYVYDNSLPELTKQFVKELLTPTDDFQNYINQHLPKEEYSIIHFRLGDMFFDNNIPDKLSYLCNLVDNNSRASDIIISDSPVFKNTLNNKTHNYTISNIIPCHLGFETDMNKVKETLYEFILVSKSNHIKTYSSYGWISGFVHSIHRIYDIPLTILK